MMRMARWVFGGVLATVVVACSRDETGGTSEDEADKPASGLIRSAPNVSAKDARGAAGVPAPGAEEAPADDVEAVSATEERTDLAPADRKLLLGIEKAQEDENFAALRELCAAVGKSSCVEVRSEYVDALGWYGQKAMAELTPFLADPDEDVAGSALSNWTSALGEIEDEPTRCGLVADVMRALRDKDTLETLVTELNDCADARVVAALLAVIGGDNPAADEVAREHYEFLTGDEYAGRAAAEKWIGENPPEE